MQAQNLDSYPESSQTNTESPPSVRFTQSNCLVNNSSAYHDVPAASSRGYELQWSLLAGHPPRKRMDGNDTPRGEHGHRGDVEGLLIGLGAARRRRPGSRFSLGIRLSPSARRGRRRPTRSALFRSPCAQRLSVFSFSAFLFSGDAVNPMLRADPIAIFQWPAAREQESEERVWECVGWMRIAPVGHGVPAAPQIMTKAHGDARV